MLGLLGLLGLLLGPGLKSAEKGVKSARDSLRFKQNPRSNFEYIGVAADRRGLVLQKGRERVEREETAVEFFVTQAISSELLVREEDEYLQLR